MASADTDRNVSVYRVGVLQAVFMDWRRLTRRLGVSDWWKPVYCGSELRYLAECVRQRKWRAVRMAFNGWLAEHAYAGTRAGHGWTKRRALADLRRHLDEEGS